MSFQIQDSYYFNGLEHNLVSSSTDFGFVPEQYGFKKLGYLNHCHRGYVAIYYIYKNKLTLEKLQIFVNPDSKIHKINNMLPKNIADDTSLPEVTHPYLKKSGDKIRNNSRNSATIKELFYDDLHIDIRYTGKLILGHDFFPFFSNHKGNYQAWSFTDLYEFKFVNGEVVNISDYSTIVKEMRNEIEKFTPWFIAQNYLSRRNLSLWWMSEDTKFHMPAYI